MIQEYTEEELTPWFQANPHPVREGWYLWDDDDGYVQSDKAPVWYFSGTVWRYWTGQKWQWFGKAVFTQDGTDGQSIWRDAVMDEWTHWRGLRETFGFKIA